MLLILLFVVHEAKLWKNFLLSCHWFNQFSKLTFEVPCVGRAISWSDTIIDGYKW